MALADPRVIDAILLLVVLEALVVVRQGRLGILPTLLSGAALLLAVRAALAGWGEEAIALALLVAGVAHAIDLWLRWRER